MPASRAEPGFKVDDCRHLSTPTVPAGVCHASPRCNVAARNGITSMLDTIENELEQAGMFGIDIGGGERLLPDHCLAVDPGDPEQVALLVRFVRSASVETK